MLHIQKVAKGKVITFKNISLKLPIPNFQAKFVFKYTLHDMLTYLHLEAWFAGNGRRVDAFLYTL